MLLFLDFDGVLHPRAGVKTFNDACMTSLASAIDPYQIEIVISSTWREDRALDELTRMISILGKPVIGITPVIDDPFMKHVRYHEIIEYLCQNNLHTQPWLAIDDTHGFFPDHAPVYWTDPMLGFCESDISKLQEMIISLG